MTSTRINHYDPLTLDFTPGFEDYEGIHHPEDGERMIDTVYFVTATSPDGVRWRREVGAAEWRVGSAPDEDGYDEPFVFQNEDPKKLEATADLLAARLNDSKTRRLNPEVWHFAGCVYGSDAYQRLDMEGFYADMEREDELHY